MSGNKADLKTFTAHGCYGATVITALIAQNTTSVQGEIVHPCPPEFVANQVRKALCYLIYKKWINENDLFR